MAKKSVKRGNDDVRVVNGQVRLSVSASQRIIEILMHDGNMTVTEISAKLGKKSNGFVFRVIRGDSALTAKQLGMVIDNVGLALGARIVKAIKDLTADDIELAVKKTLLRVKRSAVGTGTTATKKAVGGFGSFLKAAGELLQGLAK